MNNQNIDLTVPATDDRSAPKRRGRQSSNRRLKTFNEKKTDQIYTSRHGRLAASLAPEFGDAFMAYKAQQQQGTTVSKVVPFTTRGIGFHTQHIVEQAQIAIPRVEQPPKATMFQLYRFTLMQLARQMALTEPGPVHSKAIIEPPRTKISAFQSHRNYIFLADAINQYGTFSFEGKNYVTQIPTLSIEYVAKATRDTDAPTSPTYAPDSPPSVSPSKRPRNVEPVQTQTPRSLEDPYTITIFNLRDIVMHLSSRNVPRVTRAAFIKRNPIPGAHFLDDLLQNPDEIMPREFIRYYREDFQSDRLACEAFFSQLADLNPNLISRVNMDGRGNELNLASVWTPPRNDFYINGNNIVEEMESYMFATDTLDQVSRMRAYVNLVNEAPLLITRETLNSRFGIRDPSEAVHSFTESWTSLVWNVTPLRTSLV